MLRRSTEMAYRNKTYIAFDGDRDINYYRLMQAWKQNDHSSFNFHDAHNVRSARDSSLESTIKAALRERMASAKAFVLLVGSNTRYLYKFVRWEIDLAMSKGIPIIVVNINGERHLDTERCPPVLRDQLAVHVSFNAKILEHSLENWVSYLEGENSKTAKGPHFYSEAIYSNLGL